MFLKIISLTCLVSSLSLSFAQVASEAEREALEHLFLRNDSNFARYKQHLWVKSPRRNLVHKISSRSITSEREPKGTLITGDGFRYISNHIYDEKSLGFRPEFVQAGDIVFVCSAFLDDFVENYCELISEPYILITHNGNLPMPGPHVELLDDEKIITWFTNHPESCENPKLRPLPIGVANQYETSSHIEKVKYQLLNHPIERKYLCTLKSPSNENATNSGSFRDKMSSLRFVVSQNDFDYQKYVAHLLESKYLISSTPKGIDDCAIWEALFAGAIPVVESSALNSLFEGLPVLTIDHWEQLDEDLLNRKYKELTFQRYNYEKLNIKYWINEIFDEKLKFLKNQGV